jgi:hypothetical protein
MFQSNISPPSLGFNSNPSKKQVAILAGFLLGLLFDPEDGSKMFGSVQTTQPYNMEDCTIHIVK